jgi:predicted nucleic acid-binding protein
MPIVDTNVILRYVLDDNEELSLLARDVIDKEEAEVSQGKSPSRIFPSG